MSSEPSPGRPHRRRTIYIDRSLQQWLIVGLVGLETAILVAALAYLRVRFDVEIENLTYRTHFAAPPNLIELLLVEILKVMLAATLVNAAALILVDRLWRRHLARVLEPLRNVLAAIRGLDFRRDSDDGDTPHAVVDLACRWQARERHRLRAIAGAAEDLARAERGGELSDIRGALGRLRAAIGKAAGEDGAARP